ncbi:MAG: hypothetical protein LBR29_12265 [Methylobacteriaceae bacterium]|jgi:Ca2+/Na+ antiporter|nr:hypothetical protein [Methylobacteriaceae bacterium]
MIRRAPPEEKAIQAMSAVSTVTSMSEDLFIVMAVAFIFVHYAIPNNTVQRVLQVVFAMFCFFYIYGKVTAGA